MQQLRSWLSVLPFADPLERRQALTLQTLILCLISAAVLDVASILITPAPLQNRLLVYTSFAIQFALGCARNRSIPVRRRASRCSTQVRPCRGPKRSPNKANCI